MYKIIIIFAIGIIAIGCGNNAICGDCNHPINPSLEKYHFETHGGSIEITTDNKNWWFEKIFNYYPKSVDDNIEYIREENNHGYILEIKSDWFVIKKETAQKLSVKFEPNQTGNKRWIELGLQAGNCFTTIPISQSSE